jgi:hypothetical protein
MNSRPYKPAWSRAQQAARGGPRACSHDVRRAPPPLGRLPPAPPCRAANNARTQPRRPPMKSKSKKRHAAGPDQFLLGFGDDEIGAATREASDAENVLFQKSSVGWWVERSEHQKLDRDGFPVGFRYKLKQRSTTRDSGVGADTRRRFLALADLLNRHPSDPQNCPPAGQSLSGKPSTPELEPAKTSTSGGAAHDSGQEPTSLGFFSGAPPDEHGDALRPASPPLHHG